MKKHLLALIVMSLLGGIFISCSTGSVVTVDNAGFQKILTDRGTAAVLLDVRTADEFMGGHLRGAVNVDVLADGFTAKATEVLRERGAKVACVYCRSGRRSLDAAAKLSKAGFKVVNLDNGIIGWQNGGGDITKD
jgi:rhodanese-related sulfurtransferase